MFFLSHKNQLKIDKIILRALVLFLMLSLSCWFNHSGASISQGQSFGHEMMTQPSGQAGSVDTGQLVPQYTLNPQEATLSHDTLVDHKVHTSQHNDAAQLVHKSQQERGVFHHLDQDPLVTFAKELSQDPLGQLSRFYEDCHEVALPDMTASAPEHEEITCEETGDPYIATCVNELKVTVTPKPPLPQIYQFSLINLWHHQKGFWQRYFKESPGRHANSCLDFGGKNKGGKANYTTHYTYVPNPSLDTQFLTDLFALTKPKSTSSQTNNAFGSLFQSKGFTNTFDPAEYQGAMSDLKLKQVTVLPGHGHSSFQGQHFYLYNAAQVQFDLTVPPDITEEWVSDCALLEDRVDAGLCTYDRKVCTQGPQTRIINGHAVYRDCWQETYTYKCQVPARDDCAHARGRGCFQVYSQCQQFMGPTCVLYKQTYRCLKPLSGEGRSPKTKLVCGKAPLCLSGDCVDQTYPLNNELGQAMSLMSVLKEIQNQLKDGLPQVFTGQDERCSRSITNFEDCCGTSKGWGTSLGLASCSAEEKALCLKRQKRQCHRIGTYCAQRKLGVCIQKKTTFCCFGSAFLRTIQEQARSQIGLSWGTPRSPICRGLTIDELQRVDFSKMDLSEVLGEILSRYKQPDQSKMTQTIQGRMREIEESLKANPRAPQRAKGG